MLKALAFWSLRSRQKRHSLIFETWSHVVGFELTTVVEDDLEVLIILPLSPECWDYSNVPPHLICMRQALNPRDSCTSGKHCTTGYTPSLLV